MTIITVVLGYFALLFAFSRWTGRKATNDTFFRADRRSPWYMVAFGMVGASISGVTFVSVPGMVMKTQMTYLQTCMGFILGYAVVAFVLLPLYYRLNLTSIYTYLGQRLGQRAYRTGAWFFLLSKMTGAAVKFYVVCMILQRFVFEEMGVPFWATVTVLVLLIWLYTRQGGIKTLVMTDTVQTLCLLTALLLIIYKVVSGVGMTVGEAIQAVADSPMSRVFVFDDWLSPQHFWKQFLSGAFIVIVMTGLDQDMMQKNLTCRTLREARKDMCSYGVAFVPVNLLFLSLGVLLTMTGISATGDNLLPAYIQGVADYPLTVMFVLGIVAASFSTADSALTSMTTCYCIDIRQRPDVSRIRTFHSAVPVGQQHIAPRCHLHYGGLYLRSTARALRLWPLYAKDALRRACTLCLCGITAALLWRRPAGTDALGLPFRLRTADVQRSTDLYRSLVKFSIYSLG